MDGDLHADPAHDACQAGLRNRHATEPGATGPCRRQVGRHERYPEMKARLQQNVGGYEAQVQRPEAILQWRGSSPSPLRDGWMAPAGSMSAASHMPAPDEILKSALADHAVERDEVAACTSLIAMAEAVGDGASLAPLRQSPGEEAAMGKSIASQAVPLPSATPLRRAVAPGQASDPVDGLRRRPPRRVGDAQRSFSSLSTSTSMSVPMTSASSSRSSASSATSSASPSSSTRSATVSASCGYTPRAVLGRRAAGGRLPDARRIRGWSSGCSVPHFGQTAGTLVRS